MLHLADFFAPLNTFNLFIFLLFISCCEIIGYRLSRLFAKEIPSFLRGAVWLLGVGIMVLLYFLSHYFVPFSFPTILIIFTALMLFSAKFYVKERGQKSLLIFLKSNVLPFFIVLLILPQVFVKSSQPPYVWDEMAYHFVSPYALYYEKVWNTGTSLYQNLPRLLELAFISLFSLTKTYSVARFFSFSIFITFLLTAYSFLKNRFGYIIAAAFFLLTLFYPENFVLWSTFGYVDIGTTSFVVIGFLSLLDYFFDKNTDSLLFGFAFFGLAIGSKYSALTQFLTFLIFSGFLLFKNLGKSVVKSKEVLTGAVLTLFLGGYWYIKNLILTGNPIYPILFACRFESCETVSFGYTTPLIFSNIQTIYSRMFLYNKFLPVLLLFSLIFSLTLGSKTVKRTVLFTLFFVAIEILLARNIVGYDGRYFYHWAIFSSLIIVLPLEALKEAGLFEILRSKIKKQTTNKI